MGHQAIIYGRIQGGREQQKLHGATIGVHQHNLMVLGGLPDHDADWPFLTRHMFSTAKPAYGSTADRGDYKSQIIHFGASLKDDPDQESHWEKWLEKFEKLLLKKLVWHSAMVHIETDIRPVRTHIYRADRESLNEALLELEELHSIAVSEVRWNRQQCDVSEWKENWLL